MPNTRPVTANCSSSADWCSQGHERMQREDHDKTAVLRPEEGSTCIFSRLLSSCREGSHPLRTRPGLIIHITGYSLPVAPTGYSFWRPSSSSLIHVTRSISYSVSIRCGFSGLHSHSLCPARAVLHLDTRLHPPMLMFLVAYL